MVSILVMCMVARWTTPTVKPDYGPSPDPSIDATRYFKGERESWFLSFEKFVPVRNGFVWNCHLLFIFIFKWRKFK